MRSLGETRIEARAGCANVRPSRFHSAVVESYHSLIFTRAFRGVELAVGLGCASFLLRSSAFVCVFFPPVCFTSVRVLLHIPLIVELRRVEHWDDRTPSQFQIFRFSAMIHLKLSHVVGGVACLIANSINRFLTRRLHRRGKGPSQSAGLVLVRFWCSGFVLDEQTIFFPSAPGKWCRE